MTDGYRWEDAKGEFATVKCSATPEAAIGRIFARYRRKVDPKTGQGPLNRIYSFLSGPPDPGDPELYEGRVPRDIFDDLHLIHLPADSGVVFVDIDHQTTRRTLDGQLGTALTALGVGPLSANLAREEDRRITRLAMRALYSLCADGRFGPVAGIRHAGQPDPEWEAFVLWCPPELVSLEGDEVGFRWIAPWDAASQAAAKTLGLELPPDDPDESAR
jgi:hypothetical protein